MCAAGVLKRHSSLDRTFKERTESIHRHMVKRIERYEVVPFTLREFREWLLEEKFGGSPDNAVQCVYCSRWMNAATFCIDHIDPLKFGGRAGFSNLCVACEDCNRLKGAMTESGFRRLLNFAQLQLHAQDANEMFGRMKNGGAYVRLHYVMKKPAQKETLPF